MLHNFTVESQVQFHAPLAFKPTPISTNDVDSYGLTPEDLTVFINSAQWTLCENCESSFVVMSPHEIIVNLASSVSNDPVLHFVLYVPSVTQRPLYILNADGNNFTSVCSVPTDSMLIQVHHLSQLRSSFPNGVA